MIWLTGVMVNLGHGIAGLSLLLFATACAGGPATGNDGGTELPDLQAAAASASPATTTTDLIVATSPRPAITTTEPIATTSPRSTTTTTTVLAVNYAGRTYTCGDQTQKGWECASGASTVYCSGFAAPSDCSDLWYPDELASVDLVEWKSSTYVCDRNGSCQLYTGGSPPSSVLYPDIWCDGFTCADYDMSQWFELTHSGGSYICTDAMFGFQRYDCARFVGGTPPVIVTPDLYCSGSESYPECSTLWYPDDLRRYDIIEYQGRDYVCERALLGGFDDYDCKAYTGGDPAYSYGLPIYCTRTYGFECRTDLYPSEMDGVSFATIDYRDYVCSDTYAGSECWSYWGGSPRDAMWGSPDYYCSYNGCDRNGYP